MRCGLCKGELEDRLVTYTEDLGNMVVVIRHVPAKVCSECGNVWYMGAVSARLEAIVDMIVDISITEVAVVNYSDNAA